MRIVVTQLNEPPALPAQVADGVVARGGGQALAPLLMAAINILEFGSAGTAVQLHAGIARQEVFAIARRTLSDLATVSLEERIGEVFIRRLRELPDAPKAALGAALTASVEPARVRSAFELPADQRAAIQNALNETFSAEVRLHFETAADAISGIELSVGGQKLAWSIAAYLTALENGVAELLSPPAKPLATPVVQPAPPATSPADALPAPAPVASPA